jgi:succinoglycan biosynthesis transport protein ExoP
MANYPVSPQVEIKNRQGYEYVIISEDEKSAGLALKDYLGIVKRRMWLILSPLFLTIPISLLLIASQKPVYKATTRLMIEEISPPRIILEHEIPTPERPPDFYSTQYELIKSRVIAEEVVQALQLDKRDAEETPRSVQIIDTIVGFPGRIINKTTNTLVGILNSEGATRKDSNTPSLTAANANNPRLDRAIARLRSRLTVEPVKDKKENTKTNLVDISLQGPDSLEVAIQTDKVAEVYVRRNLDNKLDSTRKSIDWMKRELDALREKIKKSQLALQEFNEKRRLVFSGNFSGSNEENSMDQQQLSSYNSSYVEARTARIKAQGMVDDIDQLSKKGIEEIIEHPLFLENQAIRLLRAKYIDLKTQYSSLSSLYKDQHPKIVQIKSEIANIKNSIDDEVKKIKNSIQKDYKSLLAKEENIKKSIGNQQKEVLNINKDFAKYGDSKRDIDVDKEFYTLLSKRLAETTVAEALGANNVKIIEKAQVPTGPLPAPGLKKMLLGIIVGFGFGGCLAFIAEHFDKRFKTVDDAERELEIPFLGFIPRFQIDGRKADKLITLQEPNTIASDAYRTIRTWVQLSESMSGHTLLVTSATPGEGKSTTAANLAISFAQLGLEVLLVDADLRRPVLDRIFSLEGCIGLADILTTRVDWKEAVQYIGIDNLKILLAGAPPRNPSELLSTTRMKNLIQTWKECFDIIIFDSPITLSIPDVAIIASNMDKVLLVHSPEKTGKRQVAEANKRLKNINTNIQGIIFNNVGLRELRNYYAQEQVYSSYHSSHQSTEFSSIWRKSRRRVEKNKPIFRQIDRER